MHKKEHNQWVWMTLSLKNEKPNFPLNYCEHIKMREKEHPEMSFSEILEMVKKEREAIGLVM